ncbi:MAG: FAD-dependent oxidoreductase [Bacteroidetes bacterium B1(2017)]|nr:MAG: FAD-dependent oxidoreductase [Bacteroidetes bacterium B1(2017)]
MLSFWEKNSLINYDSIIIGAGITGLSVACELKERNPQMNILVLERGILPSGASTKNAGFACIGSLSENLHDISVMGEEALVNLVKNRHQGLQLLRNRLGDEAIGYIGSGGYELILKDQDDTFLNKMEYMNNLLFPYFLKNIFSLCNYKINSFGFSTKSVKAMILNSEEGQIDTGKMIHSLWNYCQKIGVKIITGALVSSIHETENKIEVLANEIEFKSSQLFICTNAFTKTLLPNIELTPGRGQVIATKPIQNLKLNGSYFFDDGFFYFKNFENRIIFGGGRNLQFEEERTTEFGSNQFILDKLNYYLKTLIIPNQEYEIDHSWSGIMAFSENKLPLVKKISERQFLGVRLNGMGVALGSKIAKDLVDLA